MCILCNHPVIFWLMDTVLLIPCGYTGFSLHQSSCIGFTFQDSLHCALIPPFIRSCFGCIVNFFCFLIQRRGIDLSVVQFIRNRSIAFRFNKFLKYKVNNIHRIFIRYQSTPFSAPFCHISIRWRTANIRAFFPPLF